MTNTPNLSLPYLAAGQAQKHVTLNETLRLLDALVQGSVISRNLATPPTNPLDGQRYLVGASATGLWSGKTGQIAAFQDGAWAFLNPKEGWLIWVSDEDALLVFDGSAWVSTNGSVQNVPTLGVNATADLTNRLTVSSSATLLNHAGSHHQLKINKAQASNTASLVFQTGFSGRAEIGLQGSDALGAKVSSNGADWVEGFCLKPTGELGVGTVDPQSALHVERTKSVLTMVETDTATPTGASVMCYTKSLPAIAGLCLGGFGYGSRAGANLSLNAAGMGAYAESSWVQGSSHPAYLRFDTSGPNEVAPSERMRITASGNVAIGVSNPSVKLHVNGPVRVGQYTVAASPSAIVAGQGAIIFVTNSTGGSMLAFSDGTNWRRVTDRAVVT